MGFFSVFHSKVLHNITKLTGRERNKTIMLTSSLSAFLRLKAAKFWYKRLMTIIVNTHILSFFTVKSLGIFIIVLLSFDRNILLN